MNDYESSSGKPTHPGKVFNEDVLIPLGVSVTKAAELLGVSRKTLSAFINQKCSLSPEMAIRIAAVTDTSLESWMGMQYALTLWETNRLKESVIANVKESSLAINKGA